MSVFLLMAACVLVQSIYGVGLLLFGTPILILNGMEFNAVLGLLLPSSILLSLFQFFGTRTLSINETEMIPIVVFGIVVGFVVLSQFNAPFQMSLVMAFSMVSAAVLRSIPGVMDRVGEWLSCHRRVFHLINAVLHGCTNLGGTLLTVYSTSVYKEHLLALRCTSVFYLVYALSQIAVLLILGNGSGILKGLFFLPATALIYLSIRRVSFSLIGPELFARLVTLFFWSAAFTFFMKATQFEKEISRVLEWM
jgi:hypothetical protein